MSRGVGGGCGGQGWGARSFMRGGGEVGMQTNCTSGASGGRRGVMPDRLSRRRSYWGGG